MFFPGIEHARPQTPISHSIIRQSEKHDFLSRTYHFIVRDTPTAAAIRLMVNLNFAKNYQAR